MSDSSKSTSAPIPRRGFLGLAAIGALIAALGGLAVGAFRFFRPRAFRDTREAFLMGDPGDIAMGHSYVFPKEKLRLWADEEGIRAISLVCTHLGCTVRETPAGFQCPCHGARFDKDGLVVKGPARFPLRHLALSLTADGSLLVHPSTPVTPETFLSLASFQNETQED